LVGDLVGALDSSDIVELVEAGLVGEDVNGAKLCVDEDVIVRENEGIDVEVCVMSTDGDDI